MTPCFGGNGQAEGVVGCINEAHSHDAAWRI